MFRIGAILAVLFVSLAVRLLFLAAGGVTIDSDEAIVGLMARHLLEGRPWPIFYYGQHYMGSLEPTLTALAFAIIPANEWSLKAVPLTFSLIFVYQVFLLAERLDSNTSGGKLSRAAITASILAAIPPVGFIEWSTKARGGFIELVVLGTAALLVSINALRAERPQTRNLALIAFILGLAWWVNNQAIFYIVAIGIVLVPHLIRKLGFLPAVRTAVTPALLFFIGGAPFWYYNLGETPRFQTFRQLGGRAKFPGEVLSHLSGCLTESIPILLGGKRFWSNREIFPLATTVCLVVGVLGLLALFATSKRERALQSKRGVGVLLSLMVVTPIIFSFSAFGWLTTAPRYLLPLYSSWFVILGLGARSFLGIAPVAGMLILSLASNYKGGISVPGQPYVANRERVATDHSELLAWLKKRNISHVLTNYWIGYRLAFETGEAVKFSIYSEPFTVRIPRYEELGIEYENIASFVLVPSQEAEVVDALTELNIPVERERASGYVILTPIPSPHPHADRALPLRFSESSSRSQWLERLSDSNSLTRWGSGSPQRPGMFFEGQLSEESQVSDIEVDVGSWISDAARHLSLQLVLADNQRCIVYEGSSLPLHGFYGSKINFAFPRMRAKGVRLEQQGSHPVFDWSVAEVKAFDDP